MGDHRSDGSDDELFREHVGDVRHLPCDTVEPLRRRPRPIPHKALEDERQALEQMGSGTLEPDEVETGDELFFARPGLQHALLRKLRRGQLSIRAELDLHGMTLPLAREALALFVQRCLEHDHRCVRIVHGKGRGSGERLPVLKNLVNTWLRRRDEVLAFCSTQPRHGGTGAVYVLFKRG